MVSWIGRRRFYDANAGRYGTEPFAGANGQIPQMNIWDDHDVGCPDDASFVTDHVDYRWLRIICKRVYEVRRL